MTDLKHLPLKHHDRNRLLVGCWYRADKGWEQIKTGHLFARFTYNDLGPAWVTHTTFTFDDPRGKYDEQS